MSAADILIVAGIAACAVGAVLVCRRHPGCGGDCAHCGGCARKE